MITEISGFNHPLPGNPSSYALTELANVIADITRPSNRQLRYDSTTLMQHVHALITETTGNLHIWSREYTPEMQGMLTSSCSMVASLAPLVKHSTQAKLYPEDVTRTITEGLENLCLDFHRQLYQHFNADYKLPASYIKMEAHNANIQYNRLLAAHPDNLLLKAMLYPVHKLTCQPSANSTKQRIDYINILLGNIKLWHKRKDTQEQLYEIALAMNLNCPRTLRHMAADASTRILQYSKGADRLEYINQLTKQFRNALVNAPWKSSPYGSYLPGESAVSFYISDWLSHQSELAREELQLAQEVVAPADEEDARLEINEDASYFSILIRVMVTAGLTKLKKIAPALRALCRIISFTKSQTPSSRHMIKIASSRVPDTVLNKLEAFFNECLLLIRKIRRNDGKFPDDAG